MHNDDELLLLVANTAMIAFNDAIQAGDDQKASQACELPVTARCPEPIKKDQKATEPATVRLPAGFVQIEAVLTAHQAFVVRKWAEAAQPRIKAAITAATAIPLEIPARSAKKAMRPVAGVLDELKSKNKKMEVNKSAVYMSANEITDFQPVINIVKDAELSGEHSPK